jgi:hypothetical protein
MILPTGDHFLNPRSQRDQPLYRHCRPTHSDTDRDLRGHAVPVMD